jgi:dephospho-CoA kinase
MVERRPVDSDAIVVDRGAARAGDMIAAMPGPEDSVGRSRPFVVGVAGGVGAGKSEVARAFERLGCVVSDSDREARAALDLPEVRRELVSWWGEGVVDGATGRIDRGRVAEIVFADARERTRLEGLTHPVAHRRRRALIERAEREGIPGVVVDAPLLFEAGVDAECDAVVFVEAPRATRVERVRASRGWTEAELDRREAAQMDPAEKRGRCRFVIENDRADSGELERAVRPIYAILREEAAGTT